MNARFLLLGLLGTLLGCLGPLSPVVHGQDGIYADFTTSMGNFTCKLSYTYIPTNVANFIGLVTGQRPWLDLKTGRLRTDPFYNGLKFHRVIKGFMVQAGSPSGSGKDGPGYVVRDEINPNILHNTNGILAMANSGPNSAGSQFYITVTNNASWLDGSYTIFGRVTTGMDVVNAISKVATNPTNDVPLTDVVIQNVAIRRVGAAAEAFDINAQHLPDVSFVPMQITKGNQAVTMTYTNALFAHNRLFESTNLLTWTYSDLPICLANPLSNSVQRTNDSSAHFYSVARAQYPWNTFAPISVFNKTLALTYSDGTGTSRIMFNGSGGGTWTDAGGNSGTIRYYEWSQDIYRGFVYSEFTDDLWWPMYVELDFTSNTAGTFSGTSYIYGYIPYGMSGTFTLTP